MVKTDIKTADHFTKEFFQKCLQSGLNESNVVIEDVQLSEISTNGDNYTSTIYRAKVKYHKSNVRNSNEISLIIKSMLMHVPNYEEAGKEIFLKEVSMYKIFPQIEELYKNKEIFIPKCFYVENTPNQQCIVLQDLTFSGFEICDRTQRLDEAHCKVVLRKLAKYHAGTIVLAQKEPELFKPFDSKGFYHTESIKTVFFKCLFCNALEHFTEYVEKWNGYEDIVEKLKNISVNFEEKCIKKFSPKPNQIQVLNHGDLWTNNLLFKYANGNIEGVRFIDLQVSMNDSLGLDINYFFSTSVGFDVLQTKREELIQCYHESLKTALDELNYSGSRPCLEDVKREIDNKAFYGLLISVGITPIIIIDKEASKDSTIDIFVDKDELYKKRETVFPNPKYQNFMKDFLKYCNALGALD